MADLIGIHQTLKRIADALEAINKREEKVAEERIHQEVAFDSAEKSLSEIRKLVQKTLTPEFQEFRKWKKNESQNDEQ